MKVSGMASEIPKGGDSLKQSVDSAVDGIIGIVHGLGSSLENGTRKGLSAIERAVEHNGRDGLWWTSWIIIVVLGIGIMQVLVRVRTQLMKLNDHQSNFKTMWMDDRRRDDDIRREDRRFMQEMRHNTGIRANREAEVPAQGRDMAATYVRDIMDAVGVIPDVGTDAYRRFLEELRETFGDYDPYDVYEDEDEEAYHRED
ncbi:hypothetical protein F4777DRAFT_288728 [Nemania sp. FL0916]|nr:hypothetical protein F4777DRAFT_288728 [Nemania sp. FL0916]